jgi:hypothetical protein
MSFNYSPKTVTNGLVMCLDAANTKSYPGSGTTWSDIGKNKNNGTLINGPIFNSGNGGNIVFDGIDDYVSFSTITNTIYTIEFWYKMGGNDGSFGYFASGGSDGLAINEGGSYPGLVYGQFYYYNGVAPNPLGYIPSTTNWNHICALINTSTNNIQMYGNGNQLSTTTVTSMSTNISDIGRYASGNQNFLKGNLASYRIYNRALTTTEITQNYNTLKTRFGL